MKFFCIRIGDRPTRGNFNLPPTIDERPTAARQSIESFKTSLEHISNGAHEQPLQPVVTTAAIREKEEEPEPQPMPGKRQGIIAESMNKEPQSAEDIKTRRYSKDSSSEKLIKDAIVGNEFLTDPVQVDASEEAMHEKNLPDNSFVITEGEPEYDYITLKDLEFVGTLGVGVQLVQYRKDTNLTFALKCLKKVQVVEHHLEEQVYNEKAVMLQCNACPFISKLFRTYRDNKYVYFLKEPCLGGDVFTLLMKNRFFDDHTARFMMSCVVEALEYLHERGFIFRNLQPENLLVDSQGYIKMTGFGFAKSLGAGDKTRTFGGTSEYIAPELLLSQGYDRAVDYWALGCLMHELLTGRPPFRGSGHMKTYNMILKGIEAVQFPKYVQRPASHLIRRLCRAVATERLGYQKSGVKDIKNHKWFQGFDWIGLKNRTMKAPIVQPISGPTDTSNFDKYQKNTELPPDEFSGWDKDF